MGKCKCVIILNQKGGVAKTTSAYNLAAAKAKANPNQDILMIDLDPQADLTKLAGLEPGESYFEGRSVCDIFDAKNDPLDSAFEVQAAGLDNLYIVPSDITLAETERNLIIAFNGSSKLKKAVDKIRRHFSYIIIDCPPQLGQLSINAMVAADEMIIPCKTDYLSYRALKALLDTVEQVRSEGMNEKLKVLGIIATMHESKVTTQRDIMPMLGRELPILGIIPKSAEVNRNDVDGKPVVLARPGCKAALAYWDIAEKF